MPGLQKSLDNHNDNLNIYFDILNVNKHDDDDNDINLDIINLHVYILNVNQRKACSNNDRLWWCKCTR